MAMTKVLEALVDIQARLSVPKTEAPKDRSAKYKFRSLEQINAAVKPLAFEHGCAVLYTDEFTEDGRCISTCTLLGADDQGVSSKSECYVNRNPKFMSVEQACGAASSYARKYAACGLFALDSGEDPDYDNEHSMSRRQPTDAPQHVHTQPAYQPVPNDPLAVAKGRMWNAIKAYAKRHGRTGEEILAGVKKRPEWEEQHESAEWLEAVAIEFEGADG